MGKCSIDHTHVDVKSKYEDHKAFLPNELNTQFQHFFEMEHTQDILNDVFHLLKKYDLISEEEREIRNQRLNLILQNV